MRYISWSCFLLLAFFYSSCTQQPVYSKKIEVNGVWNYANELAFPINIEDKDQLYDLVLAFSYATDFSYQNVYVKIITQYPDGKSVEDILSLNLTNGSGSFLGDCGRSKCKIDILLQEKFTFKSAGEHVITILQHGRVDELEGVYGAELKLFELK